MTQKTRKPAVAGTFYPAKKNDLLNLIKDIEKAEEKRIDTIYSNQKIIGGILPHAGYIYSGYQAVHFFKVLQKSLQKIETVVILNPNHRGFGPEIALDSYSAWETPLGIKETDEDFSKALEIPYSSQAHENEHSAEVMVPFIQYYLDDSVQIVPVSIANQSHSTAQHLAKAINKAIEATRKNIVIIASSDFSHFVDPEKGYKLDDLVNEKIENLDAIGVYKMVKENNISVCGYCPIMTLIEYSNLKYPGTKTQILCRGHSGEASYSDTVVNYICTIFYLSQ